MPVSGNLAANAKAEHIKPTTTGIADFNDATNVITSLCGAKMAANLVPLERRNEQTMGNHPPLPSPLTRGLFFAKKYRMIGFLRDFSKFDFSIWRRKIEHKEVWQRGLLQRSWKPSSPKGLREFESRNFRQNLSHPQITAESNRRCQKTRKCQYDLEVAELLKQRNQHQIRPVFLKNLNLNK